MLRNFPSISTRYCYSSNSSLPHLHHHCYFVSQLKKNKTLSLPDSPLQLLSHFSVSLYSKLLERVGYAHTSVPPSSFLMPTIIWFYPQDSTKTTLVQVTSELCSPPVLSWPIYQQLIDTSSLGGLFTQFRNHSHSPRSSAPLLAPSLFLFSYLRAAQDSTRVLCCLFTSFVMSHPDSWLQNPIYVSMAPKFPFQPRPPF